MRPIRLLAILEANTVTGPAKNLLQFAACARSGQAGPPVEVGIALFERGSAPNPMRDIARQSSLPVYPIAERGRYDGAVMPRLRAAVKEFGADVVQSHSVKSHFLVRLAFPRGTIPWVAFHHGYTWPDLRMRLYNGLDRWSLRAASRVLTVSLPFREELIRRGVDPARIEIVHNAIDPQWGARASAPEARAAMRARLGIAEDAKVVLAVGRLSREKDHATLVRAIHRVGKESGGALRPRLVLVGDGPERRAIVALAESLGLADSVTLAGQVADPAPYYGMADAAALSSRSEGSPNALLEAMAAGTPVIATAVGGVPEMVCGGESALLAPPGDAEAIAGGLRSILTDPALARALAESARRRVAADYTPEVRTRRLAEIYARIVGAGLSPPSAGQAQACPTPDTLEVERSLMQETERRN